VEERRFSAASSSIKNPGLQAPRTVLNLVP
jgi:hypothetical protein